MQISVVIPVFNEEKVIIQTIEEVKFFLKNKFIDFEIILVDDKSTDGTLEIISNFENVKVLRNLKNHGKGYTVVKGVKHAQGNLVLFMDADSSTSITELTNFLHQIDHNDLVVASRALVASEIKIRQSFLKEFIGKVGNLLIRLILNIKVKDTQCGFKLFNKQAVHLFDHLIIDGWGFDFELIFLAQKHNLSIKEMPIIWENNFDSKVKWYDYFKTIGEVFKVRFKKYK